MKSPEQIEARITRLVVMLFEAVDTRDDEQRAKLQAQAKMMWHDVKAAWDERDERLCIARLRTNDRDEPVVCSVPFWNHWWRGHTFIAPPVAAVTEAPQNERDIIDARIAAARLAPSADVLALAERGDAQRASMDNAAEPVAAATEVPSAVGQFAYCNAEKGAWVCHRPKGHEGKHDSVGCASGCGVTWSEPTPSAPDDRDRERVKAALREGLRAWTFEWPRTGKDVTGFQVDAIVPLLAEARAEGRAERLSATEEVLAKSRDLARFLEREKARREMEGTVNERAYEPDRDRVAEESKL